jgi:RNA polymerase sigma factor (TIGR02999 family)
MLRETDFRHTLNATLATEIGHTGGHVPGTGVVTRSVAPITRLLEQAREGRPGALDEVIRLMYQDLEKAAARFLDARYGPAWNGATLEPAALVNETWMQLIRQRSGFANRSHFLAIATRVMLRVLADYERGKRRQKRGGGQLRVTLSGIGDELAVDGTRMSAFADALDELEQLDARAAEVARLRLVWGFSAGEIAAPMELSEKTVARDLRFACAWLQDALAGGGR